MKKDKVEVIHQVKAEYNRQHCEYCGHSMNFMPRREWLICTHCGKKNYNKTKGYFMRRMYNELQNRER